MCAIYYLSIGVCRCEVAAGLLHYSGIAHVAFLDAIEQHRVTTSFIAIFLLRFFY